MTDTPAVGPTEDTGPVLLMQGVRRLYPSPAGDIVAVAGVDLSVEAGELVALMGPSGSGKSTLMHLAGGLDRPDEGDVLVRGVSLGGLDATRLAAMRRRHVGYVFQELNLLSSLTLAENVALPLELDGVRRANARPAAMSALSRVGLGDHADRFPDDVSGGQRQRAAIARALVGDRTLLLADEPTGALDTATGDEVMEVLRRLVDTGVAAVVVTHDSRLAAWADRVLLMRDGRIAESLSAEDPPDALLPVLRLGPDWDDDLFDTTGSAGTGGAGGTVAPEDAR